MQKNLRKIVALIAVVMLIALLNPMAATAQADSFEEPFNNKNLKGWEYTPGVVVVDGALVVPPGASAKHTGDWSVNTLSIKVRFAGEGEALMLYNSRDQGSYIVSLSPGRLALQKKQAETTTSLGVISVPGVQPDTWLELRLTISAGQHQVIINNVLEMIATDPSPLPAGSIMLSTMGNLSAEFDDLVVSGIPSSIASDATGIPTPPSAIPTPPGIIPPSAPTKIEKGVNNFFGDMFTSQLEAGEFTAFLLNLGLAVVCASLLSLVYIHWGSALKDRRRLAATITLLTITTTFIVMAMGASGPLDLVLIGALALSLWHMAARQPEELAILFIAMAIGTGFGANQRLLTLVFTAVILITIFIQYLLRRPEVGARLQLTVTSRAPDKVLPGAIVAALQSHVRKIKLVRLAETTDELDTTFLIELAHTDKLDELWSALGELPGAYEVTLVDNKYAP